MKKCSLQFSKKTPNFPPFYRKFKKKNCVGNRDKKDAQGSLKNPRYSFDANKKTQKQDFDFDIFKTSKNDVFAANNQNTKHIHEPKQSPQNK